MTEVSRHPFESCASRHLSRFRLNRGVGATSSITYASWIRNFNRPVYVLYQSFQLKGIRLSPFCSGYGNHLFQSGRVRDLRLVTVYRWMKEGRKEGRTDWLTDWLTEWMNDWLNDWLTDSLTQWLTDSLTDWLTDCLMNEWMNEWIAFTYSAHIQLPPFSTCKVEKSLKINISPRLFLWICILSVYLWNFNFQCLVLCPVLQNLNYMKVLSPVPIFSFLSGTWQAMWHLFGQREQLLAIFGEGLQISFSDWSWRKTEAR